jgi:hypothetical protein
MDIIGTAAAFAPGVGTGVSIASGIGSTLTTLGLDLVDPSVTLGEALGGLALNAGMDIAGTIPGLKATKVMKHIVKFAPTIMAGLTMLNAGPDAINAVKKIT